MNMFSAQVAVDNQPPESDEELIRVEWKFRPPTFVVPCEGASYEELAKALTKNQAMFDELVKEVKYYEVENSRLRSLSESTGKNVRSRKLVAAIPENVLPHVDTISMLGKRYAVMVYPWLKASTFVNLTGRPAVDLTGSSRYQNTEFEDLALTAELYDNVPSNLHYLMQDAKFGDLFRSASGSIRSTQAHTLRKSAALIFGLKPEYFLSDYNRLSNPEIADLLGYDSISQRYSVWCSILFPQGNAKNDLRYVFRNPALPKLLKIVFFGPSSLSAKRKPTPHTNAIKWGVTSVTDGAIAFAAIMAKFLLSIDVEFVENGAQTTIRYNEDFWEYRRFLATVSDESHAQLIAWYNERVFKKTEPTVRSSADLKKFSDAVIAFNTGTECEHEIKRVFSRDNGFASPLSEHQASHRIPAFPDTLDDMRYYIEETPSSRTPSPSVPYSEFPSLSPLLSPARSPLSPFTSLTSDWPHSQDPSNPQETHNSAPKLLASCASGLAVLSGRRGRSKAHWSNGTNTVYAKATSSKKGRKESVAANAGAAQKRKKEMLEEDATVDEMEVF